MSEQTTTNETEKKFRRRPVRKKSETTTRSAAEEKEIESTLSNIYRDERGRMPDMKEFTIKKTSPIVTFFSFVFGIGLICAVLAWAGFFFMSGKSLNNDNQVSIAVVGPTDVQLGATSTYTLTIRNNEDVGVKNASLNLYYPEGFVFLSSSLPASNAGHNEWKLDTLAAGAEKTLTINGKYFGAPEEQKSWRAFFNYTPTNFNSELQKIATLNVAIKSVPFSVTLTGTDKVAVGKEAAYTIAVKNTEAGSNYNLQLAAAVPSNFVLTSSTPALGKNNRWTVTFATSSPAGQTASFTFRGKFKDSSGTATSLKGILYLSLPTSNQLFAISNAEMTPEIIKSNIEFATAINGSLNDLDSKPGDVLNMTIRLKNTSGVEIKNGVVKLSLEAPSVKRQSLLGWSQIVDKYDGDIVGEQLSDSVRRGEISWNSKKIPALAKLKQNEEVSFDIRLPLKDAKTFDVSAIKDNTIKVNTTLEYLAGTATVQAAASPLVITLGSDLAFENRNNVTTNSQGKSEHAISWVLTHSFHGLKNLTLTADLYGDSTWLSGEVGAGAMNFDPREKRITWTIPEMPESVDVLNGSFTIILNTKNPTQNTLLSKVKVEADDTVTGKKVILVGDEVSL